MNLWLPTRPTYGKPRFRLRTLMIGLVAASLPLGLWSHLEVRRIRYRRTAAHHRSRVAARILVGVGSPGSYAILCSTPEGRPLSPNQAEWSLWHLGLALKFADSTGLQVWGF